MSTKYHLLKPGYPYVYVPDGHPAFVNQKTLDFLIAKAMANESRKCRILLHADPKAPMHQMLIVQVRGTYIRPHINLHSAKSFLLLRGEMACVLFRNGRISGIHQLCARHPKFPFFFWLSRPTYHTLVPMSREIVYIETILGPFRGTRYAAWTPDELSPKLPAFRKKIAAAIKRAWKA